MEFSNLPVTISNFNANKINEVLNVFETSSKSGKYDGYVEYVDFTYKGDNYRQITYGRSQTTEFGNLKRLLEMYVNANGKFKNEIKPYIPKVGVIQNNIPQSLNDDEEFEILLKKAAREDEIMRDTQDVFFDRYYFQPALAWFIHHKFTFPLSLLVIYDSFIHSGGIFSFLRQRFKEVPPSLGGNEKEWIKEYVDTRHDWLKNHIKPVVRASKYRTQTLKQLITDDNWDLSKPFSTQGFSFY